MYISKSTLTLASPSWLLKYSKMCIRWCSPFERAANRGKRTPGQSNKMPSMTNIQYSPIYKILVVKELSEF